MSIPESIDYIPPVPPVAPLPRSRAGFRLETARAAVLVHDLQRYFAQPFAPGCVAFDQAIANTARLLTGARASRMPVFYTAQRGDQDPRARGIQREVWGPGMRARPEHTSILDAVTPTFGDTVLTKHRYSAFARNDLEERLRSAGRDQLVIVGVYAHIGIAATAMEAFQRDIAPFVVADAVADFSAADHQRALEQVASCAGVVLSTSDVLAGVAHAA